jgi:hypothetical protein
VRVKLWFAAVVSLLAACATTFRGESHYPGGPAACALDCQRDNMVMSAFVYSGEFATSCVCKLREAPAAGAPGAAPATAAGEPATDEGVTAATVAVEAARRASEAAAGNQQR